MGTGITDPHEALVHSQDSELNSAVLERRCLGGGVGGGIYKSRNSGGLGGTQLTPVDASVDRRQRRIRPVAVTQPIPPPQLRGHWATSGDGFGCQNWGCSRHLVGGGQRCCLTPIVRSSAPWNQDLSSAKCQ